MPTDNEIARLAGMTNALRPEWPVKSLITHLTERHANRTYRDLAVALAWIATDGTTKSPGRILEAGPWWTATSMTEGQGPTQARMRCPDHPDHHAGHCKPCYDARADKPADFVIPRPRKRPFTPEGH